MIFAIDFDGTIVEVGRYDDLVTPLRLKPGARRGLASLKNAGHVLVLWSGRANRSLMYLAEFDPLVRAGIRSDASTDASRQLHADRYRQMLEFVAAELPGVFDAVDDGRCGKFEADVYIDDRTVTFGGTRVSSWSEIAVLWGE